MEWDINETEKLKNTIVEDEELMTQLSKGVNDVLKKHGVNMGDMSYVFEPQIFTTTPKEAPKFKIHSQKATAVTIFTENQYKTFPIKVHPISGPLNPEVYRELDKLRVSTNIMKSSPDPVPPKIQDSEDLIKQIVNDPKLIEELNEVIFGTLKTKGITFSETKGCVFTPAVFEKPTHAQIAGTLEDVKQVRGFGPKIHAEPAMSSMMKKKPFPGIIESKLISSAKISKFTMPGVMIDQRWWIGIPAVEILNALETIRSYYG